MAINRIPCPECSTSLKSTSGFKPGETVCCPKCATYFVVEKPSGDDEEQPKSKAKPAPTKAAPAKATTGKNSSPTAAKKKPLKAAPLPDDDDEDEDDDDEDDDDRPKAKKKKKKKNGDDDVEWSYKNSWIRYAILGVLLIVLCVLAWMLYEKQQREKNSRLEPTTATLIG